MHEVSVGLVLRLHVKALKKKHNIRQTSLAKSVKDSTSLDEIVQAAEKFREMIKFIPPQFEPKFISNTSQTAYQSTFDNKEL